MAKKKLKDKIKRIYDKLKNPYWRAKSNYIKYYDSLPIDEKAILIESQHGGEFNGNVYYIIKYLRSSDLYADYKIYLSAKADKVTLFKDKLAENNIENVETVVLSTEEYFKVMASAKYLINDNTFMPFYIKKPGQIYLNTWHGTPLKSLGRRIKNDRYNIGNAQKNFIDADYILFPNLHTRDAILKDYMVENISKGKYILSGYPRNEALFDVDRSRAIKAELSLENKKIYTYMPTFRGTAREGHTLKSDTYFMYYLFELDKMLKDDEIMYVNLHPVAKSTVNFQNFEHIKPFESKYDTYEFLNIADVLVTDYSSVFFDFACSGKKIVLFPYDKEDYLRDRGMYMSMDDLPFPQVFNHTELLRELRSEKNYDDTQFMDTYCAYETSNASQKLCDYIILGLDTGMRIENIPDNGKENILLYAGNISANGVTSSLRSLLNTVDLSERNYYFSFISEKVGSNKDNVLSFPEKANYLATTGDMNLTITDRIIRKLFKKRVLSVNTYLKLCGKRIKQDFHRHYGNTVFHTMIQFNGYEDEVIIEYAQFENNKVIFVHSDMVKEIETRGNRRKDVLNYAYNTYDKVAVVSVNMVEPTLKISGKKDNIYVVKNAVDFKTISHKGNQDIMLDSFTEVYPCEDAFFNAINSSAKKFINVSRFSPEKGLVELVNAYSRYLQKDPESYLFIMGGNSFNDWYQKLITHIEKSGLGKKIILLHRVSNPYPIVKKCDYFIFSSKYESFGLVLAEADILGLPVVCTDIDGPRPFLQRNGGTIVPLSEDGILEGFRILGAGNAPVMNVNYEEYNKEIIEQFEKVLQ